MNLDELSQKLNKISDTLKNDKTCETMIENFKDYDPNIKNMYYNSLDPLERDYQKRNDEYKELISRFSKAYLELSEWYVGPELPRDHESTFLDSKNDINSLYFLFIMSMFLKE